MNRADPLAIRAAQRKLEAVIEDLCVQRDRTECDSEEHILNEAIGYGEDARAGLNSLFPAGIV